MANRLNIRAQRQVAFKVVKLCAVACGVVIGAGQSQKLRHRVANIIGYAG